MIVTSAWQTRSGHFVSIPRQRALMLAALPVLFASTMATASVSQAAAPNVSPAVVEPAAVEPGGIEDVVNVIGFDEVRRGSEGNLSFNDGNLVLAAEKATGTIPLDAIQSFTIERSTTALMRGAGGKVIGFIPRGVGNLYHAIRRGAEVVTIYYVDQDKALHGAVLIVPKERKDDVLAGFAEAGLSPSPMTALAVPASSPASFRPATVETVLPGVKRSVSIMLPDSNGQTLPAAYNAAIYEQLNAELGKSGLFDTVWRHGDSRAPADALTLSVRLTGFKKGSPGLRGGLPIPMAGMLVGKTLITADLTLVDSSGSVLLHKQVKGSKRMSGESIDAAKSLAQRVGDAIEDTPGFEREEKPGTKVAAR